MALYDALVAVHALLALAGFGAVAVNGAYGAIARRGISEEVRRFFGGRNVAGALILVAPAFGMAAMAVRPEGSEFGQVWAVAGMVIWALAGALYLSMVRPSVAAMQADPGPGAAGRLMWAGAASDLLFVVALLLMVTQPR